MAEVTRATLPPSHHNLPLGHLGLCIDLDPTIGEWKWERPKYLSPLPSPSLPSLPSRPPIILSQGRREDGREEQVMRGIKENGRKNVDRPTFFNNDGDQRKRSQYEMPEKR